MTIESLDRSAVGALRAARVVGIALLVLGVGAILAPLVAGVTVTYLIAFAVLLGSIALIGLAIGGEHTMGQRVVGVLASLVLFAGAVAMMAQPIFGLLSLTLVVASYLFASGFARIIGAFLMPPTTGRWAIAGTGVLGIILGALLLAQWPLSGMWAIGTLVGVDMMWAGIAVLTTSRRARRVADVFRRVNRTEHTGASIPVEG